MIISIIVTYVAWSDRRQNFPVHYIDNGLGAALFDPRDSLGKQGLTQMSTAQEPANVSNCLTHAVATQRLKSV